jgi:hypothetical protein
MSIETTDLDGGIGVLFVGQGILTNQEYVDIYERHLRQDKEKFSKYRYSLSDFTEVSDTDVTNESIQFIAGLCIAASRINPYPIVALVANISLAYGLSRMFEALSFETGWEVMVFRSKEEAMKWIKERVKDKYGIDDLSFS